DPTYSGTMAVIVDARPEHIWPWLVQMGYQRGGLYSHDWLDRLFGYLDRPSATRILPEFQHLAARGCHSSRLGAKLAGGGARTESRARVGHEEHGRHRLGVAVRSLRSGRETDTARVAQPRARTDAVGAAA